MRGFLGMLELGCLFGMTVPGSHMIIKALVLTAAATVLDKKRKGLLGQKH